MLKNNGKMIVGRNFLFSLCVICLMFTAFGLTIENSFAADVNGTMDDMGLESDNMVKLGNSQDNETLKAESFDSQDQLSATLTPSGNLYKDIQDKVNAANAGDTILLKGTYYSKGNDKIIINKKLTITADSTATLDGKHLSTAFTINSGAAGTVLRNIKFINGEGTTGSAVHVYAKNVKVENCIFEDNHANSGGALYTHFSLDGASGLVVDNCQFRRNTGYYPNFEGNAWSSALTMYGRDSELKNSLFEDNWVKGKPCSWGGAIQIGLDEPGSNGKVTNCVFKNNRAIGIEANSHGGAGCIRSGTTYSNCIFINNFADEGGALTFHGSGEIRNCTFINNTAGRFGGALSTGFLYDYMDMTVADCNFDGNSAPIGGAIQANGVNILIDNVNFKNNHVTENGGAVYGKAEDVTIKDSTFNSNNASIDGGAIYILGKNTIVQDSSFIGNEAIPDVNKINDGLGGAIYVNSTQALIKNNSFRFNTARNGSAVYYDKSGEQFTLENNELYQNQAWVYQLPISAEDIYYGDSERIRVVLYGGNNIADFDNLAVSNAIYNDADNTKIVVDGQYPVSGATNSGELYQDSREYNINVLLSVQHEDGTVVYNQMGHTNYLGEIVVDLDNLKPGKYFVNAQHYEDTYYKPITNVTTFTVSPKVDIEVRKTSSRDVVNFEDVVTWTITVKNNGPNDSTDVTVYDILPEGLIWLSDTSKNQYDHKNGVLRLGNLKANGAFSFDMVTIVNVTGEIVNRVNVTSNEFDTNTTNNHDEKTIFVNPSADLAVVKSVSNPKPNYGDHVIWTVEITNNGPDAAHDVKMHDVIPKSLSYVGSDGNYDSKSGIWTVGTLENGQKKTLNIECIVETTGMTENIASVNGSEYDHDLTNNKDTERIYAASAVDLTIEKTANASTANFNDLVKWTLVISNRGPDAATNVRVIDLLPDGFTYVGSALTKEKYDDGTFVIDRLEANENVKIEMTTLVETTGKCANYANVSSDEYDYDLTNNEDKESIFINPASDLSVTKSVSDSNPEFGDIITWTIEIVNNGPDVAHNVTAIDLLPDSLIWIEDDSLLDYNHKTGVLSIYELDVGESYVLNIDCRVNGTGSIHNNVSVMASEYDCNLTNNFDNETVEVEKSADVSVIKLVNNSSPKYNDLIKWTLVISNNGPDKATDVYVEEALPEGLQLVNYTATKGIYDRDIWAMCCLENGEVQTIELVCRVTKTGSFTNVAVIYANEFDPNESNNQDNKSIEVPPSVDLQVVIEVNNTNPAFAETVNWMITVKNNGPDDATGVVLEDILPEELIFVECSPNKRNFAGDIWHLGSLNAGDSVTLNLTTVANALGTIINDVSVDANEYDWNRSNNQDDDLIDINPIADLSIEKLVDKQSPLYGENVKWTLVVRNNGPNRANNVVVRDVLTEGLEFVNSNGGYSGGIWNVGVLEVGEEKSIDIICKVISTGDIVNLASVNADEQDLNESNNKDEESIHVDSAADLSITKIASKYKYGLGDVIEYEIEVTNNGPDTARNIKVTEMLSKSLKFKSFKASKGKFDKSTMVWSISSLGYGESAKLIIKVVAVGTGKIKNTVKLTSDTFNYDMSNNDDFAVVKVTKKSPNKKGSASNYGAGKTNGFGKRNFGLNNGLGNSNHGPDDSFDDSSLNNLQNHKTADPIWLLVISSLFSIICFGGNISKKP